MGAKGLRNADKEGWIGQRFGRQRGSEIPVRKVGLARTVLSNLPYRNFGAPWLPKACPVQPSLPEFRSSLAPKGLSNPTFLTGLSEPLGSKRPPSELQMSQEATNGFWIAKTAPRGPSGTSIWAPRSPNWTPRSPNLRPKNLPRSTFWRPEIHISIKCQKKPFFLAKRVPKTVHFGDFLAPFFAGENGFHFDSKF